MISYLIKVILCSGFLLAGYHLFLEKEKMHRFSRFYLLFSILFPFIAPLLKITRQATVLPEPGHMPLSFLPGNDTPGVASSSAIINWPLTGMLIAYGVIVLLLLTRFTLNLLSIRRCVRKYSPVAYRGARLITITGESVPHAFLHYIFAPAGTAETLLTHELAHVQHRDTLTMTIVATFAGAISMLGNFAFFLGGSRENNNPFGIVGVLVAMIVAPFAAMIVQMAVSRTREYEADRRGAEICGHPLWLASALDKIARGAERIPNPDAERNPAMAHLFIINPLSGERMDYLFSTHPSTENRIAALQRLASEMAPTGAGGARATRPAAPTEEPRQPGPWDRAPDSSSEQPRQPKSNPWGRNPTGPRGPWS